MKEPKSKYGKRFSEEFQRGAVRMLERGERTAKQLSRELGVSEWSLKRWAKFHGRTDRYYQTGKPKMQQQKLPDGKANFSSVMRTLENTAEVEGRTEASRRLGGDQNSSYIRLWHACILCESRSAALLDCHTCGRAAGDQRLGSHSLRRQKRRGAWFRRLRQDQPTRHTIMN